eukprot:15356262-Ditylum_brightwellii.AAC.1
MANECEVLRNQVKGLQSDKKKNTWSGLTNGNRCTQHCSQRGVNTIIGKITKAALKKEYKDCAQKEEHNDIDEFDALSLSSSDDNNVSQT